MSANASQSSGLTNRAFAAWRNGAGDVPSGASVIGSCERRDRQDACRARWRGADCNRRGRLSQVHRIDINREGHLVRKGQHRRHASQFLAHHAHARRSQHDLVAVEGLGAQQG